MWCPFLEGNEPGDWLFMRYIHQTPLPRASDYLQVGARFSANYQHRLIVTNANDTKLSTE